MKLVGKEWQASMVYASLNSPKKFVINVWALGTGKSVTLAAIC